MTWAQKRAWPSGWVRSKVWVTRTSWGLAPAGAAGAPSAVQACGSCYFQEGQPAGHTHGRIHALRQPGDQGTLESLKDWQPHHPLLPNPSKAGGLTCPQNLTKPNPTAHRSPVFNYNPTITRTHALTRQPSCRHWLLQLDVAPHHKAGRLHAIQTKPRPGAHRHHCGAQHQHGQHVK